MEHNHEHSHDLDLKDIGKAFIIGIILNAAFVLIEAVAGFWTHSLGLLTDAGHNLSDVASLALALFAAKIATRKGNAEYTYGYKKTSVLVALFNAVLLLVAIGAIGWEAIQRIGNPHPVEGKIVAIVAFVGIFINALTAWLFVKDKDKDLNIKGAYLHMAADALVSVGVVIAGIVILYTGWFWVDTIISLVIAVVILVSTWGLLRDALRLSMDAVPKDIELSKINEMIKKVNGVEDVHHIHIWALSTTERALTAHLVLNNKVGFDAIEKIKKEVKHKLEHAGIHHITLEVEPDDKDCNNEIC